MQTRQYTRLHALHGEKKNIGNLQDFGQQVHVHTSDSLQQRVPYVKILQVALLNVCILCISSGSKGVVGVQMDCKIQRMHSQDMLK